MRLTILSVAFPFAPVGEDAVGGAEQMLSALDRALVARGHASIVVAAEGSRVAGRLVEVPAARGFVDDRERHRIQRAAHAAIEATLATAAVDVVHLHGVDCDDYLPPPGPPTLVTLHLPLDHYAPSVLSPRRPRTWLLPVSRSQAATAATAIDLLAPIENGVACDTLPFVRRKRGFALVLGRICAEKGIVDAIDAARRAGVPLAIAGRVFPWRSHCEYFERDVAPRLDRRRRWIGAVGGARKRRLLGAARCVLVPSHVAETSSLVAMEALACGTPVVAYRAGALREIVEHGRTGFLVDDVAGMADAIGACARLDPAVCRRAAAERFPLARTIDAYLALYARLAECVPPAAAGARAVRC